MPNVRVRHALLCATTAFLAAIPLAAQPSPVPAATPLPSIDTVISRWTLMAQAIAFAQYDAQRGPRGGTQAGSLNWGMLMAEHALAGGTLQLRTMLSLDALGVGARGYPLLLQSGEEFDGAPLHDRQHPHDFPMELGASFRHELARGVGWLVYAAPVGEPALGPPAFPMRASAFDNPLAPIGHHWQDATHVTFGVLTAGLFTPRWKLEGSWFNGREPDQDRWNIDPIRLDSYAARVTFDPSANWSIQSSYGYLRSPDALTPSMAMHRTTMSVGYGRALGDSGSVAATLIWGANGSAETAAPSESVLLEAEAALDARNSVIGRAEYVQKTSADLSTDVAPLSLPSGALLGVAELSLGYVREAWRSARWTIGVGAVGTINYVPAALQGAYGSATPLGAVLFVRVRPIGGREMNMSAMGMGETPASRATR